MTRDNSLPELLATGTETIERWLAAEGRAARTDALRELAEVLVDVREMFDDPDDRGPDYRGASQAYRDAVADMYVNAESLGQDDRARLSRQVRYHVSSELHRRLEDQPGALERYGFKKGSIRDRNQAKIAQQRSLVSNLIDSSVSGPAVAVQSSRRLLQRVEAEDLTGLDPEVREALRDALSELSIKATKLLGSI